MATFTRSQKLLVSTGVAALGGAVFGGAALLLAGNLVTMADAGATAADTFVAPRRPGFSGLPHAGRDRRRRM